MIDVFLYLLVIALALFHWFDRQELINQHNKVIGHYKDIIDSLSQEHAGTTATTSKLINAVIAKNTNEARDLNLTDRVQITNQPIQTPENDLMALDELSQDKWEEQVLGTQEEEKVQT